MSRPVTSTTVALPTYFPRAAEDILSNLIAYLVANGSSLKNFKPGSRIRTLLEAIALEIAAFSSEVHEFLKYGIRESDYQKFNFQLKSGNRATGIVRVFHQGHVAPYVVPEFQIDLFGLTFLSDPSPGSINPGATYLDVNVTAENPGSEYNLEAGSIDTDLGKGTVSPAAGTWDDYERITNLTAIENGTDQESEASRETRFQEFIQSLARSTVLGIKSGVEAVDGVVAAYVEENINPATGNPETGWIIVYITDGTASPPQSLLDEVKKVIDGDPDDEVNYPGYRAAGTKVHVTAIETAPISLTININLKSTSLLGDSEATAIYGNSISNFINRLATGEDVILQQVSAAAFEILPGDLHSIDFLSPGADIVVPGGQLPRIGGAGGGALTINAVNRIA